jgi:drug/metabolite transporter (DMT)-like permease
VAGEGPDPLPAVSSWGRARLMGSVPEIDRRDALCAAVGLCRGLSVLAMYTAFEYGPVTVVSPLIAGYPLVTLLLSRPFLGKEDVGPQLVTGVPGAGSGVVVLLVTRARKFGMPILRIARPSRDTDAVLAAGELPHRPYLTFYSGGAAYVRPSRL